MERRWVIILISVLVVASVAYAASTQEKTPSPEAAAITVTDAAGRVIQIDLPIDKVMIAGRGGGPVASVAYMFPSAKNLISGLSSAIVEAPLFRMIDPDIDSKLAAGLDTPNIEEMAAEAPDVVILKSYMRSEVGDPLEALGVKVVYVDLENLDTYLRDIKVLGKIFGAAAKAEEMADYYREKYGYVHNATGSIESADRPKVLLLYYSAKGGAVSFKAPGAGWLQTSMMEAAGGYPLSRELTGTGWNTVSFEQIARWNPDMMFVVTYRDDPAPADVRDMILSDPMWRGIDAVAEGRVYAFPDDCKNIYSMGSWDTPGSRWILGLEWMAKKIQPPLFSELNLVEEARDFYLRMYGLDEDEAAAVVAGITGDLR